jgi:hypothetical protein
MAVARKIPHEEKQVYTVCLQIVAKDFIPQ